MAANFGALEPDETLEAMLEQVALVSDADQVEESGGAATLMTMHVAKGLEFDVVFLAGMEDGVFPHSRSVDDLVELEEERRLCYVGITRARRHLYLTYAMSRRLMGRHDNNPPSRFLLDIPEELSRLTRTSPAEPAEAQTSSPPHRLPRAAGHHRGILCSRRKGIPQAFRCRHRGLQ